jgi:hypothetical protein
MPAGERKKPTPPQTRSNSILTEPGGFVLDFTAANSNTRVVSSQLQIEKVEVPG